MFDGVFACALWFVCLFALIVSFSGVFFVCLCGWFWWLLGWCFKVGLGFRSSGWFGI